MKELNIQFCEFISSLSTALAAGLSTENALYTCKSDMTKLYGENGLIVKEIDEIIRGVSVNIPVTDGLIEFAQRTKIEDICDFVTVFVEASKCGGNLVLIIRETVSVMQDKRHTEDEIQAMLKGKLLEQKVISVIPFLIFIYLRCTSKEFISVLYHNIPGMIIMTICLLIYVLSIIAAEKIVTIKV